jgi:hypothetical protein
MDIVAANTNGNDLVLAEIHHSLFFGPDFPVNTDITVWSITDKTDGPRHTQACVSTRYSDSSLSCVQRIFILTSLCPHEDFLDNYEGCSDESIRTSTKFTLTSVLCVTNNIQKRIHVRFPLECNFWRYFDKLVQSYMRGGYTRYSNHHNHTWILSALFNRAEGSCECLR